MDEGKKAAYRFLLYWALINIRQLDAPYVSWFRWSNPCYWWRQSRRIRFLGALANCLHNLALFSSIDFQHFDEERFWLDFRRLQERYPEFDMSHLEWFYNYRLAEMEQKVRQGTHMPLTIEIEQEEDGRWLAEVPDIPGVLMYGSTREEAIGKVQALSLRVLADRLDHGEPVPQLSNVFSVS